MSAAEIQLLFESLAGIATIQLWQLVVLLIQLGVIFVILILIASMKYR